MTTVFVVCASVGGAVLAIQFILALVGLGGDAFDVDTPDLGHDFAGDFHGDAPGDFHGDIAGDDLHGELGNAGHGAAAAHHGSSWLFGVLSFRTIVAALAFFGLAGLAAQSAGASMAHTLLVAVGAGAVAMTAVYWMMRGLRELYADGTAYIQRAVGQRGAVYLRIPGGNSGCGKVQLNLQNRTMEYLAMTAGPALPTGVQVVVTGLINPTTLDVRRDE